MALSTASSKDPIKAFNKKSKTVFKKNKNNNVKTLKEKIANCNPDALLVKDKVTVNVKAKKSKKKKSKKNRQGGMPSSVENFNVKDNKLEELKSSSVNNLSSNWKTLMNNLSKEEQDGTDIVPRPAFIRRNKKGQIITNQQMNHPKAIVIGNKSKEKKSKEMAEKNKANEKDEDEVWFDDVDPMLLDSALKAGDPEEALVKSNSFKGVTKILGMDCEMVGVGAEGSDSILARVSIVNHFGNVLYDKFVSPREKVTDYRTEVSGVRPEDLIGAPDFKTVQSEVSELIKGRILVGHAIHHDLKVLFLDHPRKLIRDTSKYKPFKAAFGGRTPGLKALSERFLGVKVQTGEHSSVQDSQATIRLYTMFRKDWEAEREAKQSKNMNSKKKKAKSTTEPAAASLEPQRLVKAKEASKSIGNRPLYADSDDD